MGGVIFGTAGSVGPVGSAGGVPGADAAAADESPGAVTTAAQTGHCTSCPASSGMTWIVAPQAVQLNVIDMDRTPEERPRSAPGLKG